jgi:hypothetical protein
MLRFHDRHPQIAGPQPRVRVVQCSNALSNELVPSISPANFRMLTWLASVASRYGR